MYLKIREVLRGCEGVSALSMRGITCRRVEEGVM